MGLEGWIIWRSLDYLRALVHTVVNDIRSEDLEIILGFSLAKDGRITLKENGTISTVGEVNFICSETALEM